ncbi:MAG: ATP-binding protein [Pseudomonadota bacterium]
MRSGSELLASPVRALFDDLNEGIGLFDATGTVYLNAEARHLFAQERAEVSSRSFWAAIEAAGAGSLRIAFDRARRSRSSEAVEHFVSSTGRWYTTSFRRTGGVVWMVSCERTHPEATDVPAQELVKHRDEFLALLGHELRNPLAPIVTALQILKLRGESSGERERAVIERQVRHMVQLVDDLLDVSRLTRGKLNLQRERVELSSVVERAVEKASPLLEEFCHHLRVSVPPGLVVCADSDRLAQVFANLLTNAAKYTPRGGNVAVRAARSGRRIRVDVTDDGTGIAPELRARIFEPFTRGIPEGRRGPGGLGLGLTLVQSLVRLHGGTVRARSSGPGRGSTFTVELPTLTQEECSETTPNEHADARSPRRRRILVVDDNEDAAKMLGSALSALGHEVRVAHDGPHALAVAREFQPEAAVLDIGLPVMDGYELARGLCALLPQRPRLIALTGYGQDSDRERARGAGFDLHLVKPVDLNDLVRHLAETPHAARC